MFRPFYAYNMYRQFIPAEPGGEKTEPKKQKTADTGVSARFTKQPEEILRKISNILGGTAELLPSLRENRHLMTTCRALACQTNLWKAPATWTNLPKVVAEFPHHWEQWIDTSEVTALTLRDVDDEWMTSVFTTVVTRTKFPKLQTLNLWRCSEITDLSVLEVARQCSNLQTLDLEDCFQITDLSVSEVALKK